MDITAQAKISKAVATHSEHAYAQAYNAGKLYIVLSVTSEKGVSTLGKETLERLQREFFALDVKNLNTIKTSVETVVKELPQDTNYTIALATSVEETLYIITAGEASALLLRDFHSSIIANGKPHEVSGFSGNLKAEDTIILLTNEFLKVVSLSQLLQIVTKTPEEISEHLAPSLIQGTTGKEAALILSLAKTPESTLPESSSEEIEIKTDVKEEPAKKTFPLPSITLPKVGLQTIKNLSRKQLAMVLAGILTLVLLGGIFLEQMNKTNNERETRLSEILNKNEQAFEDATAILSLNRSLAVEELKAVKDEVEKELNNFPEGSNQRAKLQDFLNKVNEIIVGGGGTAASLNLFYEGNSSLKPEYVTYKGGALIASTTNTIQILKTDGKKDNDFKAPSAGPVSANENSVFLLSNSGIYKILKTNGKISEIIKDISGIKSFDIFGENVYILTNTILKFKANNYDEEKYLTDPVTFKNPTSMAIDSSIWVLDEGKIRKFTKGKEEGFSLREDLPLSSSAIIYTDEDYKNLYVLDPQKKFIAIVDKEGNLVKNLELTKAQKITSFTANEKDSKIYVTSDGNIYSIDF